MAHRIPSLDGIRAVSIAMVMVSHANAAAGFPRALAFLPHSLGDLGVSVFFVVSGFVITHLLLRRGVHLGDFYLRRAFRILPPCFALLAVIALLRAADWNAIVASALFIRDYYVKGVGLDHLWSLGVEEQFYLVWPVIMCLGAAISGRVALVVIMLSPAIRVISHLVHPVGYGQSYAFHMRADGLMTGCALSIYWASPAFTAFRTWLYRPTLLIMALIFFLGVSPFLDAKFFARYMFAFGYSLNNVAIALLLCYCIDRPPAFLNWRPVVHLGLISYSLYLWQTPIVFSKIRLPLALALCLVCAEISWRFVELPAFRLRDRVMRSRELTAAAAHSN